MVIRRSPSGKMIDEPTRAVTPRARDEGHTIDRGAATGALGRDYDQPTVKPSRSTTRISRDPSSAPAPAQPAAPGPVVDDSLDAATRIAGRITKEENAPAKSAMDNPPVGWLVIIDGPGKGEVLQLGYGRNTIGRGDDVRLKLDFGDGEISRSPHFSVTYDPRSRIFYLAHEQGTNLTYVNEAPVLQPMPIEANVQISVGSTLIRFVPFCDGLFDWQSKA